MKNPAKRILTLLLTLMAVLSLSVTAFAAESSVTFEENKLIVFAPGSVYTDTDLFENFKGVMPGDTLPEEVRVINSNSDYDYIKVYMRAILHDEDGNPISDKVLAELQADTRRGDASELEYMYDFLSQLSMKVWNGETLIYDASPDQLDGLAQNVYLETLRQNESLELKVELKVPLEMGNEYAGRIGEVDWVFVCEGFDDPTPPPDDDTYLTVRKVWVDDGDSRPESVTVHLLKNGEKYAETTLNADNQWTYTWDNLNDRYKWTVQEAEVPAGYEVSYSVKGNVTTITNTEVDDPTTPPTDPDDPTTPPTDPDDPTTPPTDPDDPVTPPADPVDLTVVKVWAGKRDDQPDSVGVTLYNGVNAVETVYLGDWNNWTYTWRNLDGNGNWSVVEVIAKGYTPSYSVKNGVVTITNTATLIQTGQLTWPIPVLGGLGVLLLALGFIILVKKRKNENA